MILDFFQGILYRGYERLLIREVMEGPLPKHIATIMDGNRRYAGKIGEDTLIGHSLGIETLEKALDWGKELGIGQLTVYAFSTENFNRSEKERAYLLKMMKEKFEDVCSDEKVHKNKVRVRLVGDLSMLPPGLVSAIRMAEESTAKYDQFYLNVAIAYGGRQEILDTARSIAEKVKRGELKSEDVSQELISDHLYASSEPVQNDVDLIIRTGGEIRTSNFLPWQASGNECAAYFCAPYWPEFSKIDFLRAIRTYQTREVEKQRSTVKRAVNLLRECERMEMEEIIDLSKRLLRITREEIINIINETPKRKPDKEKAKN
ncbi:MAG: polyprenyl diphosphate synthase [Halobacteriota archaeon]|nr:polyprenyl diphosphate synthase [Halobacteriota archaeon]